MVDNEQFTGVFQKKVLDRGSKSQREAFVLHTAGGTIPVEAGNLGPYQQNQFSAFQGHKCIVSGRTVGDTLLAFNIQALDDPNRKWTYGMSRVCDFCGEPLPDMAADFCPVCGSEIRVL